MWHTRSSQFQRNKNIHSYSSVFQPKHYRTVHTLDMEEARRLHGEYSMAPCARGSTPPLTI